MFVSFMKLEFLFLKNYIRLLSPSRLNRGSIYDMMYSLAVNLLLLLTMSEFLTPFTAYILPPSFQSHLTSDFGDLQEYADNLEPHGRDSALVILRRDPLDERDDAGRTLSIE